MTTVAIVLAIIGVVGGIYAAFAQDVRVAGLATALVGLAVLLPLVLR